MPARFHRLCRYGLLSPTLTSHVMQATIDVSAQRIESVGLIGHKQRASGISVSGHGDAAISTGMRRVSSLASAVTSEWTAKL
jgi:hypothetical protein